MSMELFILAEKRLASIESWQAAIDARGHALKLSASRPLSALSGFLPVQFRERATGFECDWRDEDYVLSEMPDLRVAQPWTYAIEMRWGGGIDEAVAAYLAAASYAHATGAIIFDCQEGAAVTPARAEEIADEIDQSREKMGELTRMIQEKFGKPSGS